MARELRSQLSVPVIEPVPASVRLSLARIGITQQPGDLQAQPRVN
jgi:hypothetical protein